MKRSQQRSKRKVESQGAVLGDSTKRVCTDKSRTGLSKLETTLSAELGFAVLRFLPFEDAIALAYTNKGMKNWVLPELHRIHAREAKEDDTVVPLALQWAVWHGKTSEFEASIQAMDEIGVDSNEVVTRKLRQECELAKLLSKSFPQHFPGNAQVVRWDTGYRTPSSYLQLLDIACIRGHFDLVKVLADKAGDISQDPAYGFSSHVAYALNVDIAKFLIYRGAAMGTNKRSCAFLGLVRRAAHSLHRHQDSWRSDDTDQKETGPLAVIEYLVNSGHKLSSQYVDTSIHPFYRAVDSSVPKVIPLLFKAVGTSTLTNPIMGTNINLITTAIFRRDWEVASLLVDAGGIPNGESLIHLPLCGKDDPKDPLVKKVLELVPLDATVNGDLLTVCAIKMGEFELLEMLAKFGYEYPDKAIHFGKGKLRSLVRFIANR